MGETNETEKGKVTSSGGGGSTSEKEPELLPETEIEKRVSDRLATAGRTAKQLEQRAKALEDRERALRTKEAKITEWEKARETAEEEAARSDPDRLNILQEKRRLRGERQALDADRQAFEAQKLEHEEKLSVAEKNEREIVIVETALDYGLDIGELTTLCTKLDANSKEQIEQIAKTFASLTKEEQTPLKPDSGRTTGGENINDLPASELIKRGLAQKKK